MKPSMEIAVKLKLSRPNIICETIIVLTNPRIIHKIKHIKICQNVHEVEVCKYNPDNVLGIAKIVSLVHDIRNELKSFVND
jgi:hypothetical protein